VGKQYKDITECARSKFNFEFIDYLVDRVKQFKPDTELFRLAEGILWNPNMGAWVFHKDRLKEFETTGDLDIREEVKCPDCNGVGEIDNDDPDGHTLECWACGGAGNVKK
jgi:hypothetical protein